MTLKDLWATLAIAFAITTAAAVTQLSTITTALATPCPTEDSENCFWTGGQNGTGRSFVRIVESTYYLD